MLVTPFPGETGDRIPPARVGKAIVMVALVALGLLTLFVMLRPPEQVDAVVLEAAPGRIRVQSSDAAGPWDLRWEGSPRPGDVVRIELVGSCDCVPRQPDELARRRLRAVPTMAIALAGVFAAGSVQVAGERRRMRAASAALAAGGPVVTVTLVPTWVGPRRRPRLWFGLVSHATGQEVGWVRMSIDRTRFRPGGRFLLTGGVAAGAAVAMVSVDGRQLLLPATRLVVDRPGPTLDLGEVVNREAGWAPGQLRGADRPEVIDARLADAGRRVVQRFPATFLGGFVVAAAVNFLLVPAIPVEPLLGVVGGAALVAGSFLGTMRLLGPWTMGPLVRAVQAATGLGRSDARVVGAALGVAGIGAAGPMAGDGTAPTGWVVQSTPSLSDRTPGGPPPGLAAGLPPRDGAGAPGPTAASDPAGSDGTPSGFARPADPGPEATR